MITKVFRDIIGDDEQHTIKLATKDGSLGYRIIRFEVMQDGFGNSEMVLKIFKRSPDAITNEISFSDTNLLAAAMISGSSTGETNPEDRVIIFDREIVNQDIFVTAAVSSSADPTNYYIELEQVKLRDNENFYVSLKDIKSKLPQHGP